MHGLYRGVITFPEFTVYGVPAVIPHAFEPAICIKLLNQLGSTFKTISHFPSVTKCIIHHSKIVEEEFKN